MYGRVCTEGLTPAYYKKLSKTNKHIAPTPDDLKRYAAGKLNPAQQHEIEKALLKHPLENEALDGYEALQTDGVKVENALNSLSNRLRKRVEVKEDRKIIPLWRYSAVAASIAVLLVSGYILWQSDQQAETLAVESAPAGAAAPLTDDKAMTLPETALKKADSAAIAYEPKLGGKSSISVQANKKASQPSVLADEDATVFSEIQTPPPVAEAELKALPEKSEQVVEQKELAQPTPAPPAAAPVMSKVMAAKPKPAEEKKAKETAKDELGAAGVSLKMSSLAKPPSDFEEYLHQNIRMPAQATENKVSGEVVLEFTVNPDGSLSNFKIIKSLGYGCEEEAIRLLKASPKWTPSFEESKPVKQILRRAIEFKQE